MNKFPIALSTLLCTTLLPANSSAINPPVVAVEGIDWQYGSLESALKASAQGSGLALIYFWSDGSDFCGKLYTETLNQDSAAKACDGIVCYSAKHSAETAKLFDRYKVRTLPTMMIVRSDGEPEDIITGFIPVEAFTKEMARIRRAEGTRTGLMSKLAKIDAASEAGIDTRWLLVGKLQELGLTEAGQAHTAKIRELDPEGNTTPGAQLKFSELTTEFVCTVREHGARRAGGSTAQGRLRTGLRLCKELQEPSCTVQRLVDARASRKPIAKTSLLRRRPSSSLSWRSRTRIERAGATRSLVGWSPTRSSSHPKNASTPYPLPRSP